MKARAALILCLLACNARGFEIDRKQIQLREPIKRLSESDIPIKLHPDVTTTVKVKVVAEGVEERPKT